MTTWHAPTDTLVRFARAPEALDEVTASSVEQHLVACAECRTVVARAVAPTVLTDSWDRVADIIDRPPRNVVERMLERIGMPDDMARVVGATPGLRLAWLGTVVLLAAGAIATARQGGFGGGFLFLAPLVPLGSVLLAFLPTEEPGGEASGATPMYGAGLMMRRAVAVLAPTFAILGLAGLALPDLSTESAMWVLPSLALALASLALSTVLRPALAVAGLALTWLAVVVSVSVLDGRRVPLADTAVFGRVGQTAALAVALLAAAGLYARRDRFSTMEVTW
jgi:hypothetical protein